MPWYLSKITSPTDLGCTVHPDGSLKDASEIKWHFNKDNETPMANPMPCESQASPGTLPPSQIHPFFSGCAVPATFIAGFCCSCHATHPSNHVVDPDNVMGSVAGTSSAQNKTVGKQKAPNCNPTHLVVQKIHTPASKSKSGLNSEDSDSEDQTLVQPTCEKPTDIDKPEDTAGKPQYPALKSMADADHEVSAALAINSYDLLTQSIQSPRMMQPLTFALSFNMTRNTRTLILGWSRMDIGVNSVCKSQFSFSSTCLIVAIN